MSPSYQDIAVTVAARSLKLHVSVAGVPAVTAAPATATAVVVFSKLFVNIRTNVSFQSAEIFLRLEVL